MSSKIDFYARSIVVSDDGSHTLRMSSNNEHYHSYNGAFTESMHIFINNGLLYACKDKDEINVLEVGFGTGLNALLTLEKAELLNKNINYTAIEPYPITKKECSALNYPDFISMESARKYFLEIHSCDFNKQQKITANFDLLKMKETIENVFLSNLMFDVVYFDAFAPDIQPELWQKSIFEKLYKSIKKQGLLITYSAKGEVRRQLKEVGFTIEKLPGPPGKREITRALKNM
jgi:tRNA U34 5-methylaminomethyl-2-thiouridine-forming methyltransferase MnmC